MAILTPNTDEHRASLAQWMFERLSQPGTWFVPEHLFGITRDDQIIAVVAFCHVFGTENVDRSCEIRIAADNPRWASKQIFKFILWFGFVSLGCRRVSAIVRIDNERVQRLLNGTGFLKEGRHRDLFADCDGVSFAMTQRWYKRSKWYGC